MTQELSKPLWPSATARTIPIAGPWITELEVEYVAEAVRTAWYEGAREFLTRFEDAFAKQVGRKYALALPSCTSGIHLALAALGTTANDEVIIPESTWIASASPVTYVGATPVFTDVDPTTWCLDVNRLAERVTSNTRAIIAVDLYGGTPEMRALEDFASSRGLSLIEDAAEAIGSRRDGGPAGSFGIASVFSFHGTKTLTTGEGGMVVTDDDALFERMRYLADHGRNPGDVEFFQDEVAFKYKMSSLQAALGLAQLERLPQLVTKKRQIFDWYSAALSDLEGITLNAEPVGSFNTYWMVTAILDPHLGLSGKMMRDGLAKRLINTRPFFHPLSSLPAFAHAPDAASARANNPISYDLAERGLNLPSALLLEEGDIATVAAAFHEIIESRRV